MSLDRKTRHWLSTQFGKKVKFDEPMSRHTYLRVGGPAEAFVAPDSQKDLVRLIRRCHEGGIPVFVIGDGTNILVKDGGIAGMVIVLTRCLKKIYQSVQAGRATVVTAMAGARMQTLCRFAIQNGLEGLNFAVGIPGTVGGGIMMNAGTASGAIDGVLESVKIMARDGRMQRIQRDRLDFSYRKLNWNCLADDNGSALPVIIDGRFRLVPSDRQKLEREARDLWQKRKNSQPLDAASAGCFFKNPTSGKSAGEMIDRAGLKGCQIGGARVSTKHANFIVNTGSASAADILALMQLAQEKVARLFDILLEPEVKIIGH
jgi:UDP-N-acetylmuramate dehydrogenase